MHTNCTAVSCDMVLFFSFSGVACSIVLNPICCGSFHSCYYIIARLSADSMDIDSAHEHSLECSRQVNTHANAHLAVGPVTFWSQNHASPSPARAVVSQLHNPIGRSRHNYIISTCRLGMRASHALLGSHDF